MTPEQETFLERVSAVAGADPRLAAVALVGSHASGTADSHSDLDLVLVTNDEHFEDFLGDRDAFLATIEEPLWTESWEHKDHWFYIFASGVDGDLTVVRAGDAPSSFSGPFRALYDPSNLLAGVTISAPRRAPRAIPGVESFEGLMRGFWHDYSHLVTALGRGQLWWAEGQIEVLRGMCANLLRLAANLEDSEVGDEPYWKVELTLTPGTLERLRPTMNSFDAASMRAAAAELARLYRELAEPLAREHGLTYPTELEQMMLSRLDRLPR